MAAPINLRDYSRTAAQRGWGAGWPSCGGAKAAGTAVVSADLSGVRVSVHKRIARLVDLLMDATERRGYLLRNGQCGGYNCRAIAGTSSPSNHSWGLAVDLNWQANPYVRPRRTDMPAWMPLLWNRYGFAWGGNYGNNGTTGKADSMHLEFMGSPEQADAMTALALRELAGGAQAAAPVSAPSTPPKPKGLPEMIERPLVKGLNEGRVVCPTGSVSGIVSAAWASVSLTGGGRVQLWFQRGARHDGPAPGAGAPVDWTVMNAERPWAAVPDGTEFIDYRITADGPGSLLVEQRAK